MTARSSATLIVLVCVALVRGVSAQKLALFGELPSRGAVWKQYTEGKYGDSLFQWHWVVFTNAESGDVLSFAAHKLEPGEKRELIYLSDTAHEIFPAGHPSWAADPRQSFTICPIKNAVVKLELIDSTAERVSQQALAYTFVQEQERGTNRMAHGYALIFDEVAVFVQHTSTKPITYEFAQSMATSLVWMHHKQKTAAKRER